MPSGADALVDSSASVPICVSDHADHEATVQAVAGRRLGLAGHALFETYSVVTRLPGTARLSPLDAQLAIVRNFPFSYHLSAESAAGVVGFLSRIGIGGGSVYDALVAAAAVEADTILLTRDRRASDTYRAMGARVEIIDHS